LCSWTASKAPTINEPYTGQQRTEDGRLVGVMKQPDPGAHADLHQRREPAAVGFFDGAGSLWTSSNSPRNDMALQRKHSVPWRWGDTNRISANTKAKIDKGDFQGFMWTNGPGDRAIGEVARASFPNERFEFDKIIKNDLTEIWQVGSNQAGAFASGERSAREAGIIERNFQRRVGQEQDKVTKFFVGIAEVLAGHLALYGTFDLPDAIGPDRALLANAFTYSVRADSTVRLDAEQRIEQLTKRAQHLTAQSGLRQPQAEVHRGNLGTERASTRRRWSSTRSRSRRSPSRSVVSNARGSARSEAVPRGARRRTQQLPIRRTSPRHETVAIASVASAGRPATGAAVAGGCPEPMPGRRADAGDRAIPAGNPRRVSTGERRRRRMICERCYQPLDRGRARRVSVPARARAVSPVVRPDDIPGGVLRLRARPLQSRTARRGALTRAVRDRAPNVEKRG
jgi:hypothetical protein